jgi:hypothetical protein
MNPTTLSISSASRHISKLPQHDPEDVQIDGSHEWAIENNAGISTTTSSITGSIFISIILLPQSHFPTALLYIKPLFFSLDLTNDLWLICHFLIYIDFSEKRCHHLCQVQVFVTRLATKTLYFVVIFIKCQVSKRSGLLFKEDEKHG